MEGKKAQFDADLQSVLAAIAVYDDLSKPDPAELKPVATRTAAENTKVASLELQRRVQAELVKAAMELYIENVNKHNN
ncbi:MAG: hypothetical protein IPP69_18125 [Flavobacteriales bacterium]|nr:hypothetical protein [Flavobacteriales bacterium]